MTDKGLNVDCDCDDDMSAWSATRHKHTQL